MVVGTCPRGVTVVSGRTARKREVDGHRGPDQGCAGPVPWTFVSAPSTDSDFGTNSWLVEEMYEQFREDPSSVGEAWQEFFADYKSTNPALACPRLRPGPRGGRRRAAAPAASPAANGATATVPPRRRPP